MAARIGEWRDFFLGFMVLSCKCTSRGNNVANKLIFEIKARVGGQTEVRLSRRGTGWLIDVDGTKAQLVLKGKLE